MEEQKQVYQSVVERGYKKGWTDDEFIVRQVMKLVEEVAEVVWNIPSLKIVCDNGLDKASLTARSMFTYDHRVNVEGIDKDKLIEELADLQVVLFCAATQLGIDIAEEAVKKSSADIKRGVRK